MSDIELSRRQVLALAGAGVAGLALPSMVFAAEAKPITLLMGSGGPLLAWAPSFVAEANGFYKDEGLDVSRIYTRSGPQGTSTLVSGGGDAYFTAPGELLVAVGRGLKLKVLMNQSTYQTLFFLVSKEYAAKHGLKEDMSFEQRLAIAKKFKGFRCGVTSPGSVTDNCARTVMAQLGLQPGTDVTIVPLQAVENTIAGIANGSIDGMVIPPPTAQISQAQLGTVVCFSCGKNEIGDFKKITGHVIEARAADVEQRPDLFKAMLRAEVRGLRYIIEHPREAGEVVYQSQYAKTIAPAVWDHVWNDNLDQFTSPIVTRASLEAWITMGLVPGVTDLKAIDLDSVLDMRISEQVAKEIGWEISAL